jgi:hypothetical protein
MIIDQLAKIEFQSILKFLNGSSRSLRNTELTYMQTVQGYSTSNGNVRGE